MSANVVIWPGVTKLDLPPDRLLEAAQGKLDSVMVIGYDKEGGFYAASSYADGGDALWLLETCKIRLLQCGNVLPKSEPAE